MCILTKYMVDIRHKVINEIIQNIMSISYDLILHIVKSLNIIVGIWSNNHDKKYI